MHIYVKAAFTMNVNDCVVVFLYQNDLCDTINEM
jgi:hypothetical protein